MRTFKNTGQSLQNHNHIKANEIGFFKVDELKYNTVVFETLEGVYFDSYGCVLLEDDMQASSVEVK